ncbi:MAG: PAS domain S-box protein [Cyanobacteria bacterium P01_A01_bin.37]
MLFSPPFFHRLKHASKRIPLRFVLMVPFVLQTMAAVGITGWLSIRNGERAVSDVVEQYQLEVTSHMMRKLDVSLSIPHHINELNASAFLQENFDFKSQQNLEHHFWHQLQHHSEVNYIYAGNTRGGIVGVGKLPNESYRSFQTKQFQSGPFSVFNATPEGDRLDRLSVSGDYFDARQRPWYQAAVEARKPTWSDIYLYTGEEFLGISASHPLYDESGQLLGVLAVDLLLEQLSEFLRTYDLPEQTQAFIVERSGYLVASSTSEVPYIQQLPGAEPERRHISESNSPVIQGVATYFSQSDNRLTQIQQVLGTHVSIEGTSHCLSVLPFQDQYGLDWLIVVVMPESTFTERIQANTRQTIIMCLAALGVTIVLGSLTASWITRPILKLSDASRAIAAGDFTKSVHLNREDEVGVLARAFNTMADHLRHSFQSMEDRAADLENRVEERTRHLIEANRQLEAEIQERNRVGEQLKTSEQKYRALFDGSSDTVTIFDGRVFIDCNTATLHMFRCETKDQFCRKHPLDFSPLQQPGGQDSKALASAHLSMVQQEGTHQFQWMHQRLDGDLFWAEIWLSTVQIGEESMIQAVIRDITQRKQDEETLIDNARLSALGANIGSALTQGSPLIETLNRCASSLVMHLALDSARFWMWNPRNQTLELVASQGQYQHLDQFQRSIRIGQSRIGWIAEHQAPYFTNSVLNDLHIEHHELEHPRHPMAFAGYPLSVDGKLIGVMAVMTHRDLSNVVHQEISSIANEIALGIHHAQIEDALRESEARYRSIVENTIDLIAILTLDGLFIYASPNYKAVLGYEPSDLIGNPWAPLIHPDDLDTLEEFAHQLPHLNTSTTSPEYRVRTSQSEWRWYVSAASCIRDRDGLPLYLVSIGRDISDRIRTEETLRQAKELAESANQAKSTFLRTMSHELRTPLNGILGFAQTLTKTPGLPAKHYDGLSVIQRSGEHLLMLIEELLDFSRIEAQRMELHPTAFNLADVLDGITGLFHPRALQKGIEFQDEIHVATPQMVWGDAQRLRQVLINLIENAIKFTEEGCVILRVMNVSDDQMSLAANGMSNPLISSLSVEERKQTFQTFPHQTFRFQVEDTGSGIAPSDLAMIFHPFQQVHHPRQPQEGTGLGLSISQKLLEMMGGTLHVESQLEQGSLFWFDLTLPALTDMSLDFNEEEPHAIRGVAQDDARQTNEPSITLDCDGLTTLASPSLSFPLPDQRAIADLKDLARIGDIRGIMTYLEKLEQDAPELTSFVDTIRLRAKTFQVRNIRKFLDTVASNSS